MMEKQQDIAQGPKKTSTVYKYIKNRHIILQAQKPNYTLTMLNNIVLDSVVQYLLENKETIYNSIKIM